MQIACGTDCGKIWITVHLAAYMEWCEKQESVIPAAFFPSPFVAITWNITDHYKWKSITFTHERTRKYTHINLHIISRKYYETKRPLSNFVGANQSDSLITCCRAWAAVRLLRRSTTEIQSRYEFGLSIERWFSQGLIKMTKQCRHCFFQEEGKKMYHMGEDYRN